MGPPQRGDSLSAKRIRAFASTVRPNSYPWHLSILSLHGLPFSVYCTRPDLGRPGNNGEKREEDEKKKKDIFVDRTWDLGPAKPFSGTEARDSLDGEGRKGLGP